MSKTKVNFMEFMLLAREPLAPKRKAQMKFTWGEQITPKQKETMHNFGIGYSSMLYRGQAVIVIEAAVKRLEKGLASPAQMRTMYIMGVEDVHKRTFKEASYIINGGVPDEYPGLSFTFLLDGKETKVVRTRKKATEMLRQFRMEGHQIQVLMKED
jgi:hypothetical protein